jgi:putative peptide modification system cyclase
MTNTAPAPHATASPVTPVLRTVLLADVVDSTALVQRLGDARAAALLQRMELQLRELFALTGGQFIDRADGVLALFERPVQAVDFALRYQKLVEQLAKEFEVPPIRLRVGIHVGEVMTWANDPRAVAAGAKPLEVEGLAKPVAARLMALALPGQILMSGMAQTLAQRASAELGARSDALRWLVHGRYRFKGVPAPMLVHEVGEAGAAPLRPPPSGPKVWREVPLWRRPPVLAVEIAAVVGIAIASLYGAFKSEPALAFNQRDWVVVGDWNNVSVDPGITDSLQTALRIDLQQSAYMNVISERQIADTLRRMGRKVNSPIDRDLGSEIAARSGARALVLPTLSDVGGSKEFGLEIVDPFSRASVYSDKAIAAKPEDLLVAMDIVVERLRRQVGEPLATLASNKPLEMVTTSNLEALRAYTLGVRAKKRSEFAIAQGFFQKAVDLDPHFALAFVGLGSIRFTGNDNAGALKYFIAAEQNRERLTDREAMLLDAAHAILATPGPALKEWKMLGEMYPDEFRAFYNYAYFAHHDAARYEDGLQEIEKALSVQNPDRGSAYYLQGMLLTALDRLPEALEAFKNADSLGVRGDLRAYAEVYAAQRNYFAAKKILQHQTPTGDSSVTLEERLAEVTFSLDQGNWNEALGAARSLEVDSVSGLPLAASTQRGISLTLRSYSPDGDFVHELRDYASDLSILVRGANIPDRRHFRFELLTAGWLAARTGDLDLAKRILDEDTKKISDNFPANSDMALVLEAEIALKEGHRFQSLTRLENRASDADCLYLLHVELMRVYAASSSTELALRQAIWLSSHRGLAYSEYNSDGLLQPANVLESTLALKAGSEFAQECGDKALAMALGAKLDKAWNRSNQIRNITP